MKKALAFILTFAMVFAFVPTVAVTAESTSKDISALTQISSSDSNVTYKLTQDINLNGASLNYAYALGTNVTIDGQGHTISNFTTTDGLFNLKNAAGTITFQNITFSGTAKNAVINKGDNKDYVPTVETNFVFENVDITATITRTGGGYVGAFFGSTFELASFSFTNCDVTVSEGTGISALYFGGFIGKHAYGDLSFDKCTANGTFLADGSTDVIGTNAAGEYTKEYGAGGFVGQLNNTAGDVVFTSSVNNMHVGSKTTAGGFVGLIKTPVPSVVFRSCINNGQIDGSNVATNDVNGSARVGGFVGASYSSGGVTFERCINNGEVKGAAWLGGMLGYTDDGLITFKYCQNTGTITGCERTLGETTADPSHIGGLSGRITARAIFENCINVGTISSGTGAAGNVGHLASKVDGTCTITDCAGLGTISATASNGGAMIGAGSTSAAANISGSGNKYLSNANINTFAAVDKTADALNATEAAALKKAYMTAGDSSEANDVIAAPVLRAVQETAPTNGIHKIRLVSVVDTSNYQKGGYYLTVTDASGKVYLNNKRVPCTYLYNSVSGTADGQRYADDPMFAGKYILPLTLTNVPTTKGAISITATPYVKAADGEEVKGETVSITYNYTNNGTEVGFVSCGESDRADYWNEVFEGAFPFYGGITEATFTNNIVYGESTANPNEYRMFIAPATTAAVFEAYAALLTNSGCTVTAASEQDTGVKGYWVTKGDMRMYMYMSTVNGVARFMLETSDVQNTATEISTEAYTGEGSTTFYIYGLYQNPVGVNGHNPNVVNSTGEKYLAYSALTNNDPNLSETEYNAMLNELGVAVGDTNTSTKNTGMLLVVKLADNSVILVDGGQVAQMSQEAAIGLNNFLHEITGTDKDQIVTIRSWILTHSDGDHYEGFIRFMNEFHPLYDLERVMFSLRAENSNLTKFFGDDYLQKFYPNLQFHRLHTGETLRFADIEIDIMYTQEDLIDTRTAEHRMANNNDNSNVMRFRFDGISVMVLGDLDTTGEEALLDLYGSGALKADVMQAPHHTWNNLDVLFKEINPEYVLHAQSSGAVRCKVYTTVFAAIKAGMSGDASTAESRNYYAGDGTVGVSVSNSAIVIDDTRTISDDIKVGWDDKNGADGGDWDTFDEMPLGLFDPITDGWGTEIDFSTGK